MPRLIKSEVEDVHGILVCTTNVNPKSITCNQYILYTLVGESNTIENQNLIEAVVKRYIKSLYELENRVNIMNEYNKLVELRDKMLGYTNPNHSLSSMTESIRDDMFAEFAKSVIEYIDGKITIEQVRWW